METSNIISLVLLSFSLILNAFMVFILLRANVKRSEDHINTHRHITEFEQSVSNKFELINKRFEGIESGLAYMLKESQEQLAQQQRLLEENQKKILSVMSEVKDRVEYLSTEVNID